MACRMLASSASLYRSGHSAAPGCLPSASLASASAGRLTTCQFCASSLVKRRPARSSSCQRVMMRMIDPPGSRRVYRSSVYHAQTFSRYVRLLASSRFFTGSSMMIRSPPMPVTPAPTPAARTPPPADVSQSSTAVRAGSIGTPWASAMRRTLRLNLLARVWLYAPMMTRFAGSRCNRQAA